MSLLHSPSLQIAALVTAVACTAWSITTGLADIARFETQSYLEAWSFQSAQTPDSFQLPEAQLTAALQDGQKAVHLAPYNTDYWLLLAGLQRWQYSTQSLSAPERQQLAAEIMNNYRRAVDSRPTWPAAWAALAATKVQLGQIDSELGHALQAAVHYGPYQANTQFNVISSGLQAWMGLDATSRNTVLDAMALAQDWRLDYATNTEISRQLWQIILPALAKLPSDQQSLIRAGIEQRNLAAIAREPNAVMPVLAHAEALLMLGGARDALRDSLHTALRKTTAHPDESTGRVLHVSLQAWYDLGADGQQDVLALLRQINRLDDSQALLKKQAWSITRTLHRDTLLCATMPPADMPEGWCNSTP